MTYKSQRHKRTVPETQAHVPNSQRHVISRFVHTRIIWYGNGLLKVSVIVICIYRHTALTLGPAVGAVMRACVGCVAVFTQ